jgi:hypothetical protein
MFYSRLNLETYSYSQLLELQNLLTNLIYYESEYVERLERVTWEMIRRVNTAHPERAQTPPKKKYLN